MENKLMYREMFGDLVKGILGMGTTFGSFAIAYASDIKDILQICVLLLGCLTGVLTTMNLFLSYREKKTRKRK